MKTQAALCARDIKQVLKKKYPSIKFRVKSDNFANGNSVDISWNLGPTSDDIDKLIKGYQYGHFDGMIDMYEHSNVRDDMHQAKFVHCNREYKTEEEIANSKLKWRDPLYKDLWKLERTLYHIIGRDLCKIMKIEYKGMNERVPDDFQHMIRGYSYGGSLQNLIYQLLHPAAFMAGYHGVRHKKTEDGQEIINSFELY